MLPKIVVTPVGTSAYLNCYSYTPAIITKNNRVIERFGFNNGILHTLKFKHPTIEDSGVYKCFGTNYKRDAFSSESRLYVGGK